VDDWSQVLLGLKKGRLEACDRLSSFIIGYLAMMGAYQIRDSWDDLVQDVLIALLQTTPESSESRAVVGYVRKTTHRKYIDYLRREHGRRRRSTAEGGDRLQGWRTNVPLDEAMNLAEPETFWEKQLDPSLREAYARLDERKKRVLEAKFLMGYSNEEGASRTGEALATYKRLLKAGLEELRSMLIPSGATM
jgi:RNA polymerase sigma factor (sigma-70 family)